MQFTSYPSFHVILLSVSVSLESLHLPTSVILSSPLVRAGSVVDIGLVIGLCVYDNLLTSSRWRGLNTDDPTFCGKVPCTLRFG